MAYLLLHPESESEEERFDLIFGTTCIGRGALADVKIQTDKEIYFMFVLAVNFIHP